MALSSGQLLGVSAGSAAARRSRADLQEHCCRELTCREWNLGWTEGHGNVLQVSSIIYPSRYFLALWAPYYLSLAH